MAARNDHVPPAVEDYLVGLMASAGSAGGAAGSGWAGAKGGAFGATFAAKRLRTRVEHRSGRATGVPSEIPRRLDEVIPKRSPMVRPDSDGDRFSVPIGRTGMRVVVDLDATPADGGGIDLVLAVYCKEGLLSRRPTRRTADAIWGSIAR